MPQRTARTSRRRETRSAVRVSASRGSPPGAPEDAGGTWTRGQVARALGCSVSAVRRLEASGALTPSGDVGGVRHFDPAAVRAVAAGRARASRQPTRQGSGAETAQAAARLWLDGASLALAVAELGAPVDVVRRWWLAFEAMPGRDAASGDELAELASVLGASSAKVAELLRCAIALRTLARQRPAGAQASGH